MSGTRRAVSLSAALLLGAAGLGIVSGATVARHQQGAPNHQATEALQRIPLSFEANRGQFDRAARFRVRGPGYTAFLTDHGPVWSLAGEGGAGAALAMRLVSGAAVRPLAMDRHRGTLNYFLGNDPSGWRRGVPTFGRVLYRNVYPGIDLGFRSGSGNELEYLFRLAPGADPGRIGLVFPGADDLRLTGSGDLLIDTPAGTLRQTAPSLFQPTAHGRLPVHGRFVLDGDRLRFAVHSYDPRLPLVIDPATDLVYSSFLGGGNDDYAASVAIDGSGDLYVTGFTENASTDLPTTPGAYDRSQNGDEDAFLAKIRPIGDGQNDLLYSTFLGGSGHDEAYGVALDGSGNPFVFGHTYDAATDFPTTGGAYDTTQNGARDLFVAKVTPSGGGGADLAYSTFLGGSSDDIADAVAVEGGKAYLIGETHSTDFPATGGAYDGTYNGGGADGFVAEIDPSLSGSAQLVYSTYLGGSGSDFGAGIAVSSGILYITGGTEDHTTDLPTTAGAYDTTHNGSHDVFVAKIDPSLSGTAQLVYSTLIGGAGYEDGIGIALSGGLLYVTGYTTATFPTTLNAYDTTFNGGGYDVFISKLNPAGGGSADLVYSTMFGGNGNDLPLGLGASVAVDGAGKVFVDGFTSDGTTDLPTTAGAFDETQNGLNDGFVAKFDPVAGGSSDLLYSTFLGGAGNDHAYGMALSGGTIYVLGDTADAAPDLPVTPGAYDESHNGGRDAFVTKLFGTYRPDAMIKKGSGAFEGDDIFNVNADSQTKSAKVKKGNTKTFTVEIVNDRATTDAYTVTGNDGNSKFKITYFDGATDITASVTGVGYTISSLAEGAFHDITIKIKVKSAANVGDSKSALVNVASVADPNEQDSSKAKVTRKAG